ncbi:hypothetical protein HCN44_010662 [Aphidius gifuensis]|uniref:Uncharacterized protein n=1 Tax=Aphidius gifuensis TaxID=684658 RepID=A0A834XW28_APHGI|nr:hypothetical protein HCN44_010662 [Aphidius gifuensis]
MNPTTKKLRNSIAALFPKENEHSSFSFRYPIKPPINLGVMTILDTDYKNYAVKAAVMTFRKFYLVFAWIDSRKPTISPEHYYRAIDILRVNKIPLGAFVQIEQTCPNIVRKKH